MPSDLGHGRRKEGEGLAPALSGDFWRCFHCGFETTDEKEAAAHFGDRDDAEEFKPLCTWWRRMNAEERGQALQDTIHQLNDEQAENALLQTSIEGLEYRVEGQLSEIRSFKPFRECATINQIFHLYDSMEGRALVAEEALRWRPISEIHARVPALTSDEAEKLAAEMVAGQDGPDHSRNRFDKMKTFYRLVNHDRGQDDSVGEC